MKLPTWLFNLICALLILGSLAGIFLILRADLALVVATELGRG